MSSSSRTRVLRGVSFERAFSPLEAELPGPAVGVDPLVAAAEERRGYDDGYQAGMAEGLAAGRAAAAAESAATVARLETVGRPGGVRVGRSLVALDVVPVGTRGELDQLRAEQVLRLTRQDPGRVPVVLHDAPVVVDPEDQGPHGR